MNKEIRKLALSQYFHYFRIWFIVAAVCLAVTGVAAAKDRASRTRYLEQTRGNAQAPVERVYDFADVLTDAEEQALREYIAECENRAHADLVVVTLAAPMGVSDAEWENNMMNYADDFYDNYAYGWNAPYGDGALILDNWYEDENGSQKGSWLSTAGKMEDTIGWSEEDAVFDDMYAYIDSNVYEAYRAAISKLADYGEYGYAGASAGKQLSGGLLCFGIVLPVIVALIYATTNLKQEAAKDTTVPTTYVVTGRARVNNQQDRFLRKNVTSHRIESSSGGGGSSRGHSGGGSHGHHTSSGGHSHGGGGRRR